MGELADRLGNKSAGQLIKSEDWNGLVAAVENLSTMVDERFAAVDARFEEFSATVEERFEELGARIDALAGGFAAFRGAVEPLLGEYYRLTMETTRTSFAIGELAEITARVTDLRGNPLDLSNPADRLWIDFVVASWGQLKPAAGFESLGGAGDRTISVRTDAQGVARVHLRSDHAEGFSDEDEAEVAASLQTRLPDTDRSIAETILSAATPIEAKERQAFRVLTAEYDRTDAPRVSAFADAYVAKNTTLLSRRFLPPIFGHRWRDYRSTVMAFARRDSDPVTPDQSRGVSSIQVTFRDWIFPWIITDYFVETGPLVENLRERLAPKITNDFGRSVINVKTEVSEFISNRGLIGKQRDYLVVRDALEEVDVPRTLPFDLVTLTKPLQDAIGVQQMLESTQGLGLAGQEEVAFEAFAEATVRADRNTAQAREELTDLLQQEVSQVEQTLRTRLQTEQQSFKDSLLAETGPIQTAVQDAETAKQQVLQLQGLNVSTVTERIGVIPNLRNQFDLLDTRLRRLENG